MFSEDDHICKKDRIIESLEQVPQKVPQKVPHFYIGAPGAPLVVYKLGNL